MPIDRQIIYFQNDIGSLNTSNIIVLVAKVSFVVYDMKYNCDLYLPDGNNAGKVSVDIGILYV